MKFRYGNLAHAKSSTNWRCSLTVALTMPVTLGSNPSLYHIFLFIFHKVLTPLGIRLGLELVFLGLGIVLIYLAYDAIELPARDI